MMMAWAFALLTLGAVALATFVADLRRAVLALWVAGLAIGGIYVAIGAELLGVVQWIISTLVAIMFIFFGTMFGESGVGDPRPMRRRAIGLGLGLAIGLAFAAITWLGTRDLAGGELTFPGPGNDLSSLGHALTDNHLLSLEVLGLTLFLVLIGGGVVARPESADGSDRGEGS